MTAFILWVLGVICICGLFAILPQGIADTIDAWNEYNRRK